MVTTKQTIDPELYDDSPLIEEQGDLLEELERKPLRGWEIDRALTLADFKTATGILLLTGVPNPSTGILGTNKTATAVTLAWFLKRYFGRPTLLDFRPRQLYGKYRLVNEEVVLTQIEALRLLSTGKALEKEDEQTVQDKLNSANKRYEKLAEEWVARNESLFENAVWVMDEAWRYWYNRKPNNKMGITCGGVAKLARHLGLLILAVAPSEEELDRKLCLKYVRWHGRCQVLREGLISSNIYPVVGTVNNQLVDDQSRLYQYRVWGNRIQSDIGDQLYDEGLEPAYSLIHHCYFNIYHTKNKMAVTV